MGSPVHLDNPDNNALDTFKIFLGVTIINTENITWCYINLTSNEFWVPKINFPLLSTLIF